MENVAHNIFFHRNLSHSRGKPKKEKKKGRFPSNLYLESSNVARLLDVMPSPRILSIIRDGRPC